MAGGRPIRISVLGDSREFDSAMDRATKSADQLERQADQTDSALRSMDDRLEGVGEGADTLASKGAQVAGALTGLGDVVGGPVGGAMSGLGNAFQVAADSGDLLNAAVEGGGKLWNKTVGIVQSLTKAETYANLAKQAGAAAQWALNTAMSANPIMIVVLAIAALVAGLVWFFTQTEVGRNAWAAFTAFIGKAWASTSVILTGTWEWIKSAFESGVAAVGGFMQQVWAVIKVVWDWSPYGLIINNWGRIIGFFSSIPGKIKAFFSGAIGWLASAGRNIFTGLKSGASAAWSTVSSWIGGIGGKVRGIFSGAGSWLSSAGGNLLAGLWNGINDKIGWIRAKISSFVDDMLDWFKKFFRIGSPSRATREDVGRWLPPGIGLGIDDTADQAVSAMASLSDQVSAAFDPKLSMSIATSGSAARTTGATISITVNGALNARETARQIRDVLTTDGRLRGVLGITQVAMA